MSRSAPKPGRRGSPGSETASTGQGFGLAWAKRRKSWASACGRTTRLACTLPGAKPAVVPEKSPDRMRRRSRTPAATPRPTDSFIKASLFSARLFYHTYSDRNVLPGHACGDPAIGRWALERPLPRCGDCLGDLRHDIVKALRGIYPHRSDGRSRCLLRGELCTVIARPARDRSLDRLRPLVRDRHRSRGSDRDCLVRRAGRSLEALVPGADHPGCRRAPPLRAGVVSIQPERTAAQPRNAGSGWMTTQVGMAARYSLNRP